MSGARKIIPGLSGEEELILCCARVEMGTCEKERFLRLLDGPLDWNRVEEIAVLHRMRPLVYKHFKAAGVAEKLPVEIAAEIQRHAAFTVGRNMSMTTELVRVLKIFRQKGIEAIPFKGPVLAMRRYRNLALREFYDMDLLLRRDDILRAATVLKEQGFVARQKLDERYFDTQLGCEFQSADGKTRFELHWSFIQKWLRYHVDMEAVWRRTQKWNLAGLPVTLLANEDLLLYLCAHGAKHHWERLFWIVDIAEIVRVERTLDWSGLMARARLEGNWRELALGLYLAKTLLEAPLPEHVWESVEKERAISDLARQIGKWLFHEERRVVSGDLEETKFYLGVKERWSDRCAYSKHLLKLTLAPSEKDRAFVKLPKGLVFLYPAIRPIRWLLGKRADARD